jgi:hypothetical protein
MPSYGEFMLERVFVRNLVEIEAGGVFLIHNCVRRDMERFFRASDYPSSRAIKLD